MSEFNEQQIQYDLNNRNFFVCIQSTFHKYISASISTSYYNINLIFSSVSMRQVQINTVIMMLPCRKKIFSLKEINVFWESFQSNRVLCKYLYYAR